MGDLVGLPGVAGGRIKDVQWASSVDGAMRVLLTERAVTGAGDYGAWTVWKDDAGLYRADFSRHHITLSEKTFVSKAGVKDWLREWLPKSTDGVQAGEPHRTDLSKTCPICGCAAHYICGHYRTVGVLGTFNDQQKGPK